MNSIPLIKGNTPQEINTSIIALKKALSELEAQDRLLQGTDKDVQDKIKQINELIEGINTHLGTVDTHLDTIDGQITALQPVDTVTSGNMRSVTSNAVAKRLDNYVCTDSLMPLSKIDLNQFHAVAYIPQNIVLELKNMAGKHLGLEFGVYQYQAEFYVQVSWGSLPAVVQCRTGIGRTSYISISNNDTSYIIMTGMKIYMVSIDIPADCDFVGIVSNANVFFYNLRIS